MCIDREIDYKDPTKPVFRYKLLKPTGRKTFRSPVKTFDWKLGVASVAPEPTRNTLLGGPVTVPIDAEGFHVFVRLIDARDALRDAWDWSGRGLVIVKVACRGFKAGGRYENSEVLNEIWKEVTPIERVK